MSKAARTILIFGIYLIALGAVLVVAPNVLLRLFGLPDATDVWIRVVGMLVFVLGFYYSASARAELTPFFRFTVLGRTAVLVFFVAYVALDFVDPILILFGAIDFAGAIWTWLTLRAEASQTAS